MVDNVCSFLTYCLCTLTDLSDLLRKCKVGKNLSSEFWTRDLSSKCFVAGALKDDLLLRISAAVAAKDLSTIPIAITLELYRNLRMFNYFIIALILSSFMVCLNTSTIRYQLLFSDFLIVEKMRVRS